MAPTVLTFSTATLSLKLCYDRRSVGQSVLVSDIIWGPRPDLYFCQTVAGLSPDERTGLSFTVVAGPRKRSHSWVRVPQDSYFAVSDSWLPQLGGPCPRIYVPQEQGGPVIPSGTGFPFRRFLRLAELRWRYSNPPPRGGTLNCGCSTYVAWGRTK
jgi:hypothetical protein